MVRLLSETGIATKCSHNLKASARQGGLLSAEELALFLEAAYL